MKAIIEANPWKLKTAPKKILAIRFQALGDTIVTLPYLQSIKTQYPETRIDFLTRKEVSPVPMSIKLFDEVIAIGGGRNAKIQFALALLLLPKLLWKQYDGVIDLQNHRISKVIRRLLNTKAWTQFDRSSPISAGERTRQTIEALWTWKIKLQTKFVFKNSVQADKLLIDCGWRVDHDLVVLNPAGFCQSRNWPLSFFTKFAKLWLQNRNHKTQFVLLLLPVHKAKSNFIAGELKSSCIDLTGKANQLEAFAILQKCKLVLTEDSGLMHMSWVQSISTLALFSSSRKDWSAPQGDWSGCLDSSDMECGPCGLEVCKFGDNRCLTRYSAEFVMERAINILQKQK